MEVNITWRVFFGGGGRLSGVEMGLFSLPLFYGVIKGCFVGSKGVVSGWFTLTAPV